MDIAPSPTPEAEIPIVGLGPGDRGSITQDAFKELHGDKVHLGTRVYPTMQQLPSQNWNTFDYLYDRAEPSMAN